MSRVLSLRVSTLPAATRPGAADAAAIERLIAERKAETGYSPLSDQAWVDFLHGAADTMITVEATDGEGGPIVGYAQATEVCVEASSPAALSSWSVETLIAGTTESRIRTIGAPLLESTIAAIRAAGGDEVTWLVQRPSDVHDDLASARGLKPARRLHQMRRALPTGLPFDVNTRPFDPARDIDDWVRVNARAFAWNPEQGSWTADNVRARITEPWFDADGFLIHERTGADGTTRMAGFCWTKVHEATATSPRLGEIYVIAVDPDFHGLGLGRALTLAGLDSLARRGLTIGMLYVDADNTVAVKLYDNLGFTVHRTDCLYTGQIASG